MSRATSDNDLYSFAGNYFLPAKEKLSIWLKGEILKEWHGLAEQIQIVVMRKNLFKH